MARSAGSSSLPFPLRVFGERARKPGWTRRCISTSRSAPGQGDREAPRSTKHQRKSLHTPEGACTQASPLPPPLSRGPEAKPSPPSPSCRQCSNWQWSPMSKSAISTHPEGRGWMRGACWEPGGPRGLTPQVGRGQGRKLRSLVSARVLSVCLLAPS